MEINWLEEAINQKEYSVAMRRDFHRHPEPGFSEHRTAQVIAGELEQFGLDVKTGVAQTGVLATLQGGKAGKTVMLRFDMDALPVNEENEADYASETPGVMHACGHDGHMAAGLTIARMLSRYREQISGRVIFLFQPAEEGATGSNGAPAMVKAGVLDDPKPDAIMGYHLWNYKPLGWIGLTPGPLMASIDFFKLNVTGKGGHAAAPHENTDPLVAACELVSAIQTIVSRNIPPVDSAVVSVTMVHAGDSPNVTPSKVNIEGTIRTYDPQIRERVIERIIRLANGICSGYQCQFGIKVYGSNPAVINDAAISERITKLVSRDFPDWEVDTAYRTMLSEDFACYLQHVPGCFVLLGSANTEKGLTEPHHSPRFNFDEDALPRAAALLAASTMDFLQSN